jgi:hypothetical protein
MALTLEFDDAEAAVLLDRLGLPEDTTDTQLVLDTLKDALRGAPPLMTDAPPSQIAAAARKAGLDVVDTDTLAALRHDAQEGRQLAAAAKAQKIEAAVDAAVGKGKIPPSRKKHWITLCTNDEGMVAELAAIPNETAFPVTELGHSTDVDENADKPVWFY